MAKPASAHSLSRPQGRGKKIGIVASKFNDFITKRLLNACLAELHACGVKREHVTTVFVPGALEIPVAALKLAKKKNINAVICLGAVIRGETYHFEVVSDGASRGIAEVALQTEKPVIFGVLTTNTPDQAYKRSEEKGDNKGREAAITALEMIDLLSQL